MTEEEISRTASLWRVRDQSIVQSNAFENPNPGPRKSLKLYSGTLGEIEASLRQDIMFETDYKSEGNAKEIAPTAKKTLELQSLENVKPYKN